MIAKLINGNVIANIIYKNISKKIIKRKLLGLRPPGLAVILIGNNPASKVYIRNKHSVCKMLGIMYFQFLFSNNCSENDIIKIIDKLNLDTNIDGIIIQLPLPKNFNYIKVLERIFPDKDVDGFHPYNMGRLAKRIPMMRSCTPKGIMTLLKEYKINVQGINATIIGASNIVGRPMALELLLAGSTITVCHRFTNNIQKQIGQADLLVVAIGKPSLIKGTWIKTGAIVIDVGINKLKDGSITGDVEFNSAINIAKYITPVPGGVGPMTIASLIENILFATELHDNFKKN
ncbi:Bifunctional protein FolD [Candidatus Johnevansia muelleri]|uniref:Bifunctional protein FolD n=1 Tax=Candidatus Johnevansia muelleri TaxID=1495769 RepID=A0A078KI51_9GAMM|nr:Bifunctional protein FolD [Candidatus Evansia muelleri]